MFFVSPAVWTWCSYHRSSGLITGLWTTIPQAIVQFNSVQLLSRVHLFATPWTAACQASLSITNSWSLFKLMSIKPVILSSHLILSSPSPPAFNLSQHQGLFQGVSSLHQVAKVLELQLEHQSFQWIFKTDFLEDWLVWSPHSPKDSQESSPTPQFKSINSLMLSFLHGSIFTSTHDYWKNHRPRPRPKKKKGKEQNNNKE